MKKKIDDRGDLSKSKLVLFFVGLVRSLGVEVLVLVGYMGFLGFVSIFIFWFF